MSQITEIDLPKKAKKDLKIASSHPMIRTLFKDGNQLKSFLNSFPDEFGSDKVFENLFSEKNSAHFGKNLANRDKTAFESIKKTFCSSEYKEGNLLFSDFSALTMNVGFGPLLKDKEERLYSFCQGINAKKNKPMLFSSLNQELSKDLPIKLKQVQL